MTDDDDRKAKDMVFDSATQRDLERWFGLPSFQQLDEEGKKPAEPHPATDPEVAAVIARRDKALANVDPAFLDSVIARHDDEPEDVVIFEKMIDVRVAEKFGVVDEILLERAGQLADPRSVERPDDIDDVVKECTPQALLRDLHRSERDFDKQFEVVDMAAEQRLDIVAEVKSAMSTRWTIAKPGTPPLVESERLLAAARAERRAPWTSYLPRLRNRTVKE